MARRKPLSVAIKAHPWHEHTDIEGVMFGRHIVFKVTFPDRVCYSLWGPHAPVPATGNPQDDFLRLHDLVVLQDDQVYDIVDAWDYLPGVVSDTIHQEARKEYRERFYEIEKRWRAVQQERIKALIEMWHPEAAQGFIIRSGVVTILTGNHATTSDLDDITDNGMSLEPLVGWRISHDMFGEAGRLVKLDSDPEDRQFAVRWIMKCARCPKRMTVYTGSGCHHGAWCYAVDRKGEYIADLRNDGLLCVNCSGQKKRKKPARQKT